MLKISYYFNNKEVWEGLQRAGDTTDGSGPGTLKYLRNISVWKPP